LELESSELANKLIQGQVGRAEEVETTFTLKRELAAVRQHYLETMKHLENVTQQYQNLLLVLDETVRVTVRRLIPRVIISSPKCIVLCAVPRTRQGKIQWMRYLSNRNY